MEEIIFYPCIICPNVLVLTGISTNFEVAQEQEESVKAALENDGVAVFAIPRPDGAGDGVKLYDFGFVGTITQSVVIGNGNTKLTVAGGDRVRITGQNDGKVAFIRVPMQMMPGDESTPEEIKAGRELIEEKLLRMSELIQNTEISKMFRDVSRHHGVPMGVYLNGIVIRLSLPIDKKYSFVYETNFVSRMNYVIGLLDETIGHLEVKRDLEQKVRASIDKNQKDYFLREELKNLKNELGDGADAENDELRAKIEGLNADDKVKEKLLKELDRLAGMPFGSNEATVIRGYLDTLLELPWNTVSEEEIDLKKANEILERDHYGMEKIKERVIEYLAVRKLNGGNESTILCLAGPPGTGKTSIARSIAEALGRKYVRISLGGIHDEAEIRGHRKTYIGAMPGRIVAALRQAKTANPVILLDELDKLGKDYKGDPSSALLEVLDSEQNVAFRDNFVELPINLSQVIFIATANDPAGIPAPLRDRVELITVDSYTQVEKEHIAKKYLIRKQVGKHGLGEDTIEFTDDAVKGIIKLYTREAGVRELERKIGAICRKCARLMLEEGRESFTITQDSLPDYLGKVIYKPDEYDHKDAVGIVRGLAWTAAGGEVLEVEVNVLDGKGTLLLTGKQGDVMKESAQTALSYVRSICSDAVGEDFFEKHDIHLHVPEGAVPKDGPSAGITFATAIYSAVTNTPVKGNVAMTGEVTLRGRILPIGGLREKILAANTAGMEQVFVPVTNEADVAELDGEVIGDMKINFVSEMEQVIAGATTP
ncbi:MAG: endopeptidase La [Lachnospiraceae bacterium]|nr:endopeptidase La [Lachnospiraceae bacterium]